MHNTPLQNTEFNLAFVETNLRWLLADTPRDEAKIAAALAEREKLMEKVEKLRS